jgi:hypothetical protein
MIYILCTFERKILCLNRTKKGIGSNRIRNNRNGRIFYTLFKIHLRRKKRKSMMPSETIPEDTETSSISTNELIDIDLQFNSEDIATSISDCTLLKNESPNRDSVTTSPSHTEIGSIDFDPNIPKQNFDIIDKDYQDDYEENDSVSQTSSTKNSLPFRDGTLVAAVTRMAISFEQVLWRCGPCHNYQRKQVEFEEQTKQESTLPLDVQLYQHYFSDD